MPSARAKDVLGAQLRACVPCLPIARTPAPLSQIRVEDAVDLAVFSPCERGVQPSGRIAVLDRRGQSRHLAERLHVFGPGEMRPALLHAPAAALPGDAAGVRIE